MQGTESVLARVPNAIYAQSNEDRSLSVVVCKNLRIILKTIEIFDF
jgi:hypothetical protein